MPSHIVLVRHGQTEWTLSGQHTGRNDIPLTSIGREQAGALGKMLDDLAFDFEVVLTSPAIRARETANLAGYSEAEVEPYLAERDYGIFEGRRTVEIRQEIPGWSVWTDRLPDGETLPQVGARADRVIQRVSVFKGDIALFGHGHALRVLAARWLGLAPVVAAGLILETAAISVLGWERENRAITHWNEVCHLRAQEEIY